MFTVEQKVDALLKLAVCNDPNEVHELRRQIVEMVLEGQLPKDAETTPPKVEQKPNPMADIELEDAIIDLLRDIGVRTNLVGYRYTVHAVELVYSDPTYMRHVTSRLYTDVAKIFGATSTNVERGIRHCIETAFECGSMDTIQAVFGYTIDPDKGKPTNSQFISAIAEIVRQRMRKGR